MDIFIKENKESDLFILCTFLLKSCFFFKILQLTSIAAQCSRSEDPFNLQEQHCPLVYQLFAHNDILFTIGFT